jgi:hypothetical protein
MEPLDARTFREIFEVLKRSGLTLTQVLRVINEIQESRIFLRLRSTPQDNKITVYIPVSRNQKSALYSGLNRQERND